MVELTPAARRSRRLRLRLLIILAVVLAPLAVGVGYASAGGWGRKIVGDDTHGPLSWVGQCLIFIGLGVEVVGLVRMFRARQGKPRWDSPLLGMSGERRRVLRDQLRGRRTIDAASLLTVRLLAQTRVREYGNFVPVTLGLMIMEIGQLLIRRMSAVGLLMISSLAILAFALVWSFLEVRRARSFLQAHPEEDADHASVG